MHKIRTIAEIGSNWNGDNNLAKKIISLAKDSGLDYVKFQMWRANDLYNNKHPFLRIIHF